MAANISSSLGAGMGAVGMSKDRRLTAEGAKLEAGKPKDQELRETFDTFVGEAFFGQMLSSMRKTVGKPAYFHGGRAEEMFTERLDQVLSEEITKSSASQVSGPMFELFMLNRGA
jgi:peptidoglycan hydrolase FlgJ